MIVTPRDRFSGDSSSSDSSSSNSCFTGIQPEHLQTLLDTLPGIHFSYHYDANSRQEMFLNMSGQVEELLELTASQIVEDPQTLWNKCQNSELLVNVTQNTTLGAIWQKSWNITHSTGKTVKLDVHAVNTALHDNGSQTWSGLIQQQPTNRPSQPLSGLSSSTADRLPGFIYRLRYYPDGRSVFEYVSKGVEDVFDCTAEQLCADGEIAWRIMHDGDRDKIHRQMMINIKEGQSWHYQWRVCTKTRGIRWVSSRSKAPEILDDGSKAWNGIIEDITDQHAIIAPQAPHDSDQKQVSDLSQSRSLYNMLDIIPGAVMQTRHYPDDRLEFMYISTGVVDLLGISQQAIMANADVIWATFHPDDLPGLVESINDAVRNEKNWEHTWRVRRDGIDLGWLRGEGRYFATLPDGSILRVAVVMDITHEKQLESVVHDQRQALDNSENTLRKMTDVIAGVIVQARYDSDGPIEYLYVSQGVREVLGITREDLMADSQLFWKVCHPDDRAAVRASIRHAVESREDWEFSWRICRPGGQQGWVRVSSRHYKTMPDGTEVRVSCFVDVTNEQQLKQQIDAQIQALQNTEQTLSQITNVIPGVIIQARFIAQGPRVEFRYVSKGAQEVLGVTNEQLMADSSLFWKICYPADLEALKSSNRQAIENCADWSHSWRIQKNGQIRWVKISGRHFQSLPDGSVIRVGCLTDITHERYLEQQQVQLEEDVQQARQMLVDINNVIPGCVYMVRKKADHSWDYPFMSAGGESLFERPLDELKKNSRVLLEYSHPDDKNILQSKLDNAFRFNGLMHVVWRILTPAGKVKWIRGDSRPFRSESDGSILRAGFFVDVTRERELEESLNQSTMQLRHILEAIPGGLYQSRVHPDGSQDFVFTNKTVWTQAGLPPDTPLSDGHKLLDGIVGDDRHEHKESTLASREKMSPRVSRFRFRRYDNDNIVHIEVHSRPSRIKDSDDVLFTGVALDVTNQAVMEDELIKAKIKAEEASVAKSTFLANVSHEMRTPLNGILGYAQLLSHALTLSGQPARNLLSLRQCSDHLLSVINEVLDMAKIESGRLDLDIKPMALYRLLNEVESVVTPLAANKDLSFQLHTSDDLPGYIQGDATRLRQILINLLNNAVKFTDSGEITLRASMHGEELQFMVEDSGSGIPPSRIDKIFQPFERLEVHHAQEGTGLGLAITRRIIDGLGGTITLESEVNRGSCFTVLLPCEEAEAIEETPETSEFQLQELDLDPPPRLLVVDDRESNRDVMKQWLTLGGFEVIVADNGQEALDCLRDHPCDMVLSDLRMPIMGGLEMIDIIQNDEQLKNIPCVAVSASVFPDQVRKVLSSGFRSFLPKPCSLPKLFSTIYDTLNLRPSGSGTVSSDEKKPATVVDKNLPEDERNSILDMLDMGDIEGLQARIHKLEEEPGLSHIAHRLGHRLDDLDMEGFRQILRDN